MNYAERYEQHVAAANQQLTDSMKHRLRVLSRKFGITEEEGRFLLWLHFDSEFIKSRDNAKS